jgi:hypothetical protein
MSFLTIRDPSAQMFTPSSCGTKYLVLGWRGHGGTNSRSIWRTNADESDPLQLTHGNEDRSPVCSPDQKWVYYFSKRAVPDLMCLIAITITMQL